MKFNLSPDTVPSGAGINDHEDETFRALIPMQWQMHKYKHGCRFRAKESLMTLLLYEIWKEYIKYDLASR